MPSTVSTIENAGENVVKGSTKAVSNVFEELKDIINGKNFLRWVVGALLAVVLLIVLGKVGFEKVGETAKKAIQ